MFDTELLAGGSLLVFPLQWSLAYAGLSVNRESSLARVAVLGSRGRQAAHALGAWADCTVGLGTVWVEERRLCIDFVAPSDAGSVVDSCCTGC